MLPDAPEPADPWPWIKAQLEEHTAHVAGPIDRIGDSWKIVVYTDQSEGLEFLRKYAYPYIPETDDHEETPGVVVIVLPTDAYDKVDLGPSGVIDGAIADDLSAFEYVDAKGKTPEEYHKNLQAVLSNTINWVQA